jgi:ankyrin repeat protein
VAQQHGFQDWADAWAHREERVDRRFEAAADAVVSGDRAALETLVAADPTLVRARSAYGHRATLLHHVAANGVEAARQWSPPNAPDIAGVLLAAGADPDAGSNAYGGTCVTTLCLLVSSCHPADANVQADLVDVLCRGGARPDGLEDEGAPLWTAITSGYTRAARRLVACGARVDNPIAAAALGDLASLERYFGEEGRSVPIPALRGERFFSHGRPFDASHLLEYALCYAAFHGQRAAVQFLLSRNPDLRVKEPAHGSTALGMARYPHHRAEGRPGGSPDIAAILEERMRP